VLITTWNLWLMTRKTIRVSLVGIPSSLRH
jgi:hypothetical protein